MSALGWLNYCLLQWLWVRLAYADVCEVDVGTMRAVTPSYRRWQLLLGVWPLSGWDGRAYRYVQW